MNLSADQDSVGAEEVAPPSQPHRLSTSCDVHPEERFSGFCPSCLCERLSVLDHNGAPPQPASSSSRKPATAALKALFKPSSANGNGRVRAGFFPELRRSKSFSAKNKEGISGGLEPQRRSCDVRLREENRNREGGKMEDEGRKSSVSEAVAEEEKGSECEIVNEMIEEEKSCEIAEEKAMKEYMDLYPQTKKPSSVRSFPFFSAASVFSKKLQKWRNKQKKKPRNVQLPVEKAQPRDTQSEIAGRRSSDTDPRFSLDAAGRFSVDIGRISVDEPRASWDGHLPPLARVPPPPSMLSVVENAQSDMQVPTVEETSMMINGGESDDPIIIIPGGSSQTRDYYTEPPSSRRRKSLDRSNSIKKAMEMEEVKSNVRVSPAAATITYTSSSSMVNQNGGDKKSSRRWGKWSMFGFIYRKGVSSKDEEEDDRYSRSNSTGVVERSLSESWPDLRNEAGGGPKMRRSNSNVSWRSSSSRNKSWRNSSKDGGGDNGMLRFYLTPSWRNGGGGSGWEKTAAKANSHGHSIARRVMRLY
ncbi:hypothetical protein Rs2_32336 [Raphanus sativus]|uniref:Protein OCTOPUS-like n=1 Tax=Raphanus sativus TaxID=3726 RepID=A0A6J0KHB5_RAPSA|nr:protein OCTOPUS-like [Raphanus sativus]KAJ4882243.1 hypothetical protein Rs2_32336 [Raphanus sativus]